MRYGWNADRGNKGCVIPGNGGAEFQVKYRAIVWKPFKVRSNEIYDNI